MNKLVKNKEGDFYKNRLLLKLCQLLEVEKEQITEINPNVFLVTMENKKFFVKRYKNKANVLKQIWFTNELKKHSLSGSVYFRPFNNGKYIRKIDGKYFALMPFFQGKSLSFSSQEDRVGAYQHIRKIQLQSEQVINECPDFLPFYSLQSKWTNRLDTYYHNLNNRLHHLSRPQQKLMKRFLKWGDYALDKMPFTEIRKLESQAAKKGLIVHGDVANHNFLKQKNGDITLIDYDLLACAPPSYDILQLINRYFPYINFSLSTLFQDFDDHLHYLLKQKWFVLALIYPTDIYREWNRLCTTVPFNEEKMQTFIAHMERQYDKRLKMINDLLSII